ncbi:MAG: hypothetical protein Q4E28_03575 [Clostridia bacterium]|nr:hypothetical protein [Clostridia bacterium]
MSKKSTITHSKSNLFLIEIVIVILFLSITAAVCMKTFSSARLMVIKATENDNAALIASNIAEEFKASDDEKILEIRYYDKNFNQIQNLENAIYKSNTKIEKKDNLEKLTVEIKRIKSDELIFDLQVGKLKGGQNSE